MDTLEYILKKFGLEKYSNKMPVEIPNFGRDQLADLLHELDFKIGVEVGVAAGEYSLTLCKANPQMKIYGIDPWEPYKDYRDYTKRSTFEKLYLDSRQRLDQFGNYQFVKKFSMEAVKDFANESIDFVYIDANHNFQNVTNDIVEWGKRLKRGGIISGHDYFKPRNNAPIHVTQVLQGYTDAYHINPWFVLGREANNEGLIRDMPRSWMWVKI